MKMNQDHLLAFTLSPEQVSSSHVSLITKQNKMQLETVGFAPMPPGGKIDQATLSDIQMMLPLFELGDTRAVEWLNFIHVNCTINYFNRALIAVLMHFFFCVILKM